MVGEILDAKYRIDKQLGAGGMGTVFLGTHLGTTRIVAVKVIAPKWAAEPQFLARFQREAQACGRLRHPNIVNVTDFGVARAKGRDVPYLVMEYLDGQTLSEFQKENPRPALPLIADLLDQIGLALTEAHRYGIVHRDLKPDNVWLEPNGRGGHTVKVLDFGVAKLNLLSDPAPSQETLPIEDISLTANGSAPIESAAEPRPEGAITSDVAATPLAISGDEFETVAMGLVTPPEPLSQRSLSTQSSQSSQSSIVNTRAEDVETLAIAPMPSGLSSSSGLSRGSSSGLSSGSFDSGAAAHTMPGSLLGTPAYMSPEQAFGREVDFRSDIYNLAVVAYSLVCGQLPFTGKSNDLLQYHESGVPTAPRDIVKIPRDVSDTILAGLARNPADRPASAVVFSTRFRNAVDAEFLALRRSKAFLLQHLGAFALLLIPGYGALLAVMGILAEVGGKKLPIPLLRIAVIPLVAAGLLIFSDNVLRAAAALMAVDEQQRVRRFMSFRVFWKLIKLFPTLVMTQIQSAFFLGRGWVIGDCLWPVICVVEKLKGRAAIQRSRNLMTGLQSAGRALAIRHFALAALAIADALKSIGFVWGLEKIKDANIVVTSVWFPVFALFAGAPLFLYDRTANRETGPLLQLDRTPEVRTTARALSISSIVWLVMGLGYLVYEPIKRLIFGGK